MPRSSLRKNLKLKPSRLAKKRKKAIIFRIVLYLVFVGSVITGISFISGADFLVIKGVKIQGLETLTENQIKEIVAEKTDGRILGLFSRSNIFLYPKEEIKLDVLKKYRRVVEAKISLRRFSFLDISIKERKPFGLWCYNAVSEKIEPEKDEETEEILENSRTLEEKCFFLDKTSFIFDIAPQTSTSTLVKYFGEIPKGEDVVGKNYLNVNLFQNLSKFLNLLSSGFEIKIEEITKYDSTIEILLNTETVIKIYPEDDLEKVFENVTTLISDPEFKKEKKTIESFRYIDLRFGQKIFYKLK